MLQISWLKNTGKQTFAMHQIIQKCTVFSIPKNQILKLT